MHLITSASIFRILKIYLKISFFCMFFCCLFSNLSWAGIVTSCCNKFCPPTKYQAASEEAIDLTVNEAYELGIAYADGVKQKKDVGLAIYWLSNASSHGCSEASLRLGAMYERNDFPIPIEEAVCEASHCYELAIKQGNKQAQVNLDNLLFKTGSSTSVICH